MHCGSEPRLVKVGELAQETGKSIRTLHYYEELGLLRPAKRSEGGYRLYDANAVARIRTIERLQALSVPLARIRELAHAWGEAATGREAATRVRAMLDEELGETRRRLRDLREIEAELERSVGFLADCGGCDERPERDRCGECGKGSHVRGSLPDFIGSFLN
ncbi:MAG TPA: MerR family transcriptional regulator [Planctomycetota bacterium]|nr:MerR family transcriptional regulator [Planctomycetota bacterium]